MRSNILTSLSLFVARTAITAWIGAAILFVIVGISEVTHAAFSSEIRDHLVVIRFPWYYRFGFTAITASLVSTLLVSPGAHFSSRRKWITVGLLIAAILAMTVEYYSVYVRLEELVTPAGKPRTLEFMQYHQFSMYGNLVVLLLCVAAMLPLNWPTKSTANP